MFAGAIAFNNGCATGDTSCPLEFVGGNTASLTTVASMFEGATVFNQNVASWDTADVTTMHYAFSEAAAFNNGCDEDVFTCPLNWNTHLVTNMNNMLRLVLFSWSLQQWLRCRRSLLLAGLGNQQCHDHVSDVFGSR
jgi:surface protein